MNAHRAAHRAARMQWKRDTHTQSTRPRRGVTLMELIVALVITGFMAAVGTATFGSIIDSKHVVQESTTDTERAAALRETLRQWLLPATIRLQQGSPPRGTGAALRTTSLNASTVTQNGAASVTAAAANGDEVTFTTTAPNPTNAPNARLRLFIDADEATPERGLTLEYQVTEQSPLQRRELDSAIQSMTVEYLDSRTSRWFSAAEAATIQPRAIRISMHPAEGATVPALMELPLVLLVNYYGTVIFQNSFSR